MPHKLCPKCSKPNGVRTHNCECGYSFIKEKKKIPIVDDSNSSPEKQLLNKNHPDFLQQMALGISVAFRFKWEGDDINLVDAICACRPLLNKKHVAEYCKLTLEELWKK